MTSETQIDEAKFDAWVPLAHAIRRLNGGHMSYPDSTIEAVSLRLRDGSLRIAAEKATWREPDDQWRTDIREELYPKIWEVALPSNDSRFWRSGDLQICLSVPRSGYGYATSLAPTVTIIGARLHPGDTQRLAISMGVEEATPTSGIAKPAMTVRRQDLPIVPEPIAQAFVTWAKGKPDGSKEAAEKAAAHMFPNHNLSRDRIRELWGPGKIGRPSKEVEK